MSYNTPESMAAAEIISEISEIHSDLKGKFDRIHVLSQSLYSRVRRGKPDDNTSIYLQYANAWIRFSGMANQGAMRTVRASKVVLKRLAPEAPETPVEKPKTKKEKPKEASPVESLMGMYSDEELEELDVSVLVPEEADSSGDGEPDNEGLSDEEEG